jgi:hypothetical protein
MANYLDSKGLSSLDVAPKELNQLHEKIQKAQTPARSALERSLTKLSPRIESMSNKILMPAGGMTPMLQGKVPLSPEGQKAVNISAGLHEGFERGVKTEAPFGGHRSPRVLLNESNLLSEMRGQGADDARRAFGLLRKREAPVVEKAVARLSGGRFPYQYGQTHLPKAMRRRLETMLAR